MKNHTRKRKAGQFPSRQFSHRAGASSIKRRNKSSNLLGEFQKEITVKFFELLNMIKLYHWKTFSYATHKASDDLYSSLNDNIDNFMEVLFGKSLIRTNLMNVHTIKLKDLNSQEELKREIMSYKSYLVELDKNKAMNSMSNSDLYNIRDEILGDLNKFMYLLTLK